MPVSHIGLTVSHLPTSTSFFLAALQPLGYRYIGQSGDQVGLGIQDADFFLCQETPGVKSGAAHIAFTAPSTTAVREFYTAALRAGARPNGAPATRCMEDDYFNAAVLDFDGNSIEVVHRNGPDTNPDGTVISHSRVITWRKSVLGSYRDDRSVVSSRQSVAKPDAPEMPAKAASVVSKAPSIIRSVSAPTVIPPPEPVETSNAGNGAAKTLIGTLLGAAAGAAVAYAMVSSERDSARKESEFSAYMVAKETVKAAVGHLAQTSSQPQQSMPADPQPTPPQTAPPAPQSVHRKIDSQSYYSSAPSQPRSACAPRQIEAAPPSYYQSPTYASATPTQITDTRAIEYLPAHLADPLYAPSQISQARSKLTAQRSHTSPELLTLEKTKSVASTVKPETVVSKAKSSSRSVVPSVAPSQSESVLTKVKSRSTAPSTAPRESDSELVKTKSRSDAHSIAPSGAPSTLISSFVPDHVGRRSSAGSVQSHHSSRSKAKSTHSHVSRHSKHTSRPKEDDESSTSPAEPKAPSKAPSKAATIISSILGRDKSKANDDDNFIDDLDIEELTEDDDLSTVVPSDSISQIGGPRRRKHRNRSEKDVEGSVVSKISSASKHSKHTSRSHRSHRTKSHVSEDAADDEDSSRPRRSSRPSIVSEPSDASTAKPTKASSKTGKRKDSVTQGQYDGLLDKVQYGTGSVAVRGITPSMISAAGKNHNRSMINFNLAQKMRTYEH